MLHLLDPQVAPLDSLDTFKQRVQLPQEIAERMMDLLGRGEKRIVVV